ncbi:hypothetical protein NEIRO03_2063 [Nematocida sp. AWRm78]|nr:hypothetical protein NEIRO03_2063 [Nematocida sp. AWRm78]
MTQKKTFLSVAIQCIIRIYAVICSVNEYTYLNRKRINRSVDTSGINTAYTECSGKLQKLETEKTVIPVDNPSINCVDNYENRCNTVNKNGLDVLLLAIDHIISTENDDTPDITQVECSECINEEETYDTPMTINTPTRSVIVAIPKLNTIIRPIRKNSSKSITANSVFTEYKRHNVLVSYDCFLPKKKIFNAIVNNTPENFIIHQNIKELTDTKIRDWVNDRYMNIWMLIKTLENGSLKKLAILRAMAYFKSINIEFMTNPMVYNGFIPDLVNYIDKYGQTVYNYIIPKKSIIINNGYKETIGDILANGEISIYFCCSGIDRQNPNSNPNSNLTRKPEDILLKKKLNTILYIPEVYEDLFNIPITAINEFLNDLSTLPIKNHNNTELSHDDIKEVRNEIYKLMNNACFIRYLISTVHKDYKAQDIAYRQIKYILQRRNLLYTHSMIDIYNIIINTLQILYKYFPQPYKISTRDMHGISQNISEDNMDSIGRGTHYKVLGAPTVKKSLYAESSVIIKNITRLNSPYINQRIEVQAITSKEFVHKTILLDINDHYHIQFINNSKQTVEIIHLPLYIHQKGRQITETYYLHTINEIVDHLKIIFRIGNDKDSINKGNVYPFKYCRSTELWSLITNPIELSQDICVIEDNNCNVLFYYIEEDIYKTEFCCAQFLYPEELKRKYMDINSKSPRIPLFLSKLFVSSNALGPYDENTINYNVYWLNNYTDIKPVAYMHTHTTDTGYKLYNNSKNPEVPGRRYAAKYYYNDFFILNSHDPYEDHDCYGMNIRKYIATPHNDLIIKWNTQIYNSVYEYSAYNFYNTVHDKRVLHNRRKLAIESFVDMLQCKLEYTNRVYYGFCFYKVRMGKEYTSCPIFCLNMKPFLNELNMHLTHSEELKHSHYSINNISSLISNSSLDRIKGSTSGSIFIRRNNYNKCSYGIHYDILNIINSNNPK